MFHIRANSACAILALALATAFVHASTPALDPILKDLDSDDPEIREAASEKLTDNGIADLRSLFDVMKQEQLSLEQRTRIERALRPLFENSPRAGLGVSFDRTIDDGSVRIIGTVDGPGFHAHEFLKPGDVVRELDGISVHTQDQARSVILSHDPGDIMEVMVVRQGTPIRAAIRLGSFADLDTNRGFGNGLGRNPTSSRDILAALRVRIRRELGDVAEQSGAPAIDAGFSSEAWDVLHRKVQMQRNHRLEKEGRDSQVQGLSVSAGGVGRFALVDATHQPVKRFDQRLTNIDRQRIQDAIAQRKTQLQKVLDAIDANKNKLLQKDLDGRDRAKAAEQLDILRRAAEDLDAQIQEGERILMGR